LIDTFHDKISEKSKPSTGQAKKENKIIILILKSSE
jgi:hypothetical protein